MVPIIVIIPIINIARIKVYVLISLINIIITIILNDIANI
jgi:hypothetical protein